MNIEQFTFPLAIAAGYALTYLYLRYSIGKTIDKAFEPVVKVFHDFNNGVQKIVSREDYKKIQFIETYEWNAKTLTELQSIPYENLHENIQKYRDEIVELLNSDYKKYQNYKSEVGSKQHTVRYSSWQRENQHIINAE